MDWNRFGGERVGSDALLLADFAQSAGQLGADLGCGSGVILLLLLLGDVQRRMIGVDIRENAVSDCRENLRRFALGERGTAVCADYRTAPIADGTLDFVVSNPPYFPAGCGAVSPDPNRAAQRTESATVSELCRAAARYLKPGGSFFLVHRTERKAEILAALCDAGLVPIRRRDIFSAPGKPAPVFLLEAQTGSADCVPAVDAVTMHGADGCETEEYRKICRWEA